MGGLGEATNTHGGIEVVAKHRKLKTVNDRVNAIARTQASNRYLINNRALLREKKVSGAYAVP